MAVDKPFAPGVEPVILQTINTGKAFLPLKKVNAKIASQQAGVLRRPVLKYWSWHQEFSMGVANQ